MNGKEREVFEMEKKGRSLNSIRVSHEKHTASCATEKMAVPETVCISMAQHIGAPCKPLVAKGDRVKVGQKIGDTEAFVSAPIHSGVSGTVKEIATMRSMAGGEDQVVIIETDGIQEISEEVAVPVIDMQRHGNAFAYVKDHIQELAASIEDIAVVAADEAGFIFLKGKSAERMESRLVRHG